MLLLSEIRRICLKASIWRGELWVRHGAKRKLRIVIKELWTGARIAVVRVREMGVRTKPVYGGCGVRLCEKVNCCAGSFSGSSSDAAHIVRTPVAQDGLLLPRIGAHFTAWADFQALTG